MYKRLLTIAGLIALLSVITLPAQAATEKGLTITTVNSSRADPEEIVYRTTEEGFEVRGVIKRRFHNEHIRGYVDVALIDANGEILESLNTKLQRISYSNKHLHQVAFKVLFSALPAGATTLRVTHHIGTEGDQPDK